MRILVQPERLRQAAQELRRAQEGWQVQSARLRQVFGGLDWEIRQQLTVEAQVPADHFSSRWTRYVNFEAGSYRFTILTDDGIRFWIDDHLVPESWQHQRETYEVTVYLEAGYHRLRVEHWEDYGWAALSLRWEPAFTVHTVFLPLTLRSYRPPCDPYEPNDSRYTNPWGPLASGQPYQAKLCSGDPEDNFYFDASTSGTVTLHLQLPPSLVNHSSIWLYAQSNLSAPFCGTGPVRTGEYTVSCPISQAGRYIVRLYPESGFFDDANPYTLRVTYP